jgi:hypothetical protein
MSQHQHLEALGQPVEEPAPEGDNDFASEHADTVVDKDITAGRDSGEPETPGGFDGLDEDGTP